MQGREGDFRQAWRDRLYGNPPEQLWRTTGAGRADQDVNAAKAPSSFLRGFDRRGRKGRINLDKVDGGAGNAFANAFAGRLATVATAAE
jgi:hypothetical protein